VDPLVAVLGSQSGISKSQVSRICQEIDAQVQAVLAQPSLGTTVPIAFKRLLI